MSEPSPKKKVVKVEASPSAKASTAAASESSNWKPSAEAKASATKLRIIAVVLWVLAIAGEAFAIFYVLRQPQVKTWLLILLIVVIGLFSIGGALLWKKANTLDPASRKDKVRFFIQNQLGVIIAIIAFLPLIILIFTNKNMSGKQKALAGTIGIVVALAVGLGSAQWGEAPSVEGYAQDKTIVNTLNGEDAVYWTKGGSVYHLCEGASDVNKASKDGQIYTGSIASAQEAGKARLTYKWRSEAKQCGIEVPATLENELKDVKDGDQQLTDDKKAPADEESAPAPAESATP